MPRKPTPRDQRSFPTPLTRREDAARSRVDREHDPALLVSRVLRLHSFLEAALPSRLEAADLPPLDLVRLLLVFDERVERRRPTQLAAELGLSRSGVSRLLDRAEAAGLVDRVTTVMDDRGVTVGTTAHGRRVLDGVRRELRRYARDRWLRRNGLDQRAAAEATRALERLVALTIPRATPTPGTHSSKFRNAARWGE